MSDDPLKKLLVEQPRRRMLAESLDGLIFLKPEDYEVSTDIDFQNKRVRVRIIAYLLGKVASNALSSGKFESGPICPNNEVIGDDIEEAKKYIEDMGFVDIDSDGCVSISSTMKAADWLIKQRN